VVTTLCGCVTKYTHKRKTNQGSNEEDNVRPYRIIPHVQAQRRKHRNIQKIWSAGVVSSITLEETYRVRTSNISSSTESPLYVDAHHIYALKKDKSMFKRESHISTAVDRPNRIIQHVQTQRRKHGNTQKI